MSIVIENLSYIYMKGTPYEKTALNNISLTIKEGEFVGIIGHTGSGKSTLTQHLNGLLKPSSGRVIINGVDISSKNLKQLRRQVGIVFQYPEYQLFDETVYKDVAFGLVKQGMKEDLVKTKVTEAIKMVGLDDEILERSPFELSGGQKRRVAIAGVLVMEPGILVMDEPAAGLDPRGRDEVYELISHLHRKQGMTVILVSHNMEDIARLVNRVIVMNNGQIEMDGPIEVIFKDAAKLESIGLSIPQITQLMKRLKKDIHTINEEVYNVEQAKKEIEKLLKGKMLC